MDITQGMHFLLFSSICDLALITKVLASPFDFLLLLILLYEV